MPEPTDPTANMDLRLSRRAFVALSTGAAVAAGAATAAPTLAAGPELGQFHPPFVAEDDPDIEVVRPKLDRPDGAIDAYAAAPKHAASATPGVVVVRGTWIRVRAGVDSEVRPPKVGVAGFCMGGAMALRASVGSPQFDAAAVWYGKIRQGQSADGPPTDIALDYAASVRMPLLGSYGARDTSIPAGDVRALRERLKVPNDLKVYDEAGHAFFDDQRKSYVASAALDAWARTLAWLAKFLRA